MTSPDATRSYVICAEARSGSNLVVEALRATGMAGDPDEWYDPAELHRRLAALGLAAPGSTPDRPVAADGPGYLRALVARAGRGGRFGLKIHRHQYELGLRAGLGDPFDTLTEVAGAPAVILLTREDRVRQAVSTYIAARTGIYLDRAGVPPTRQRLLRRYWHGLDCPGPELTTGPVPFDFDEIDAIVGRIEADEQAWRHLVAARGLACCEITYEQLTAARAETLRRVFDFLGLGRRDVPAPTFRRQSTELNERFAAAYRLEKRRRAPLSLPALPVDHLRRGLPAAGQ